jgi:hypothetical protein
LDESVQKEGAGVKKIPLIFIALWIGVTAAHAAGVTPDKELDEFYAVYTEHKNIYDACYSLRESGVLTGPMREQILKGATDRRKAMACVLAITSVEAGMRVTDTASIQKLRDYFMGKAKCVEAEVDLHNAKSALEMYYLDNAKYPATLDDVLGVYLVSFKSKMWYRLETDFGKYVISATNPGCDKTLSLSSDSVDIITGEASGP